jgi:prepilin signal peptidase PulO-like enzyme (type II secretory pathway)
VELYFATAAAVLGAIAGSFLNALSFRFNTGRSVIWGGPSTLLGASRSRCMRCGATLGALDLVPVFSFVFLRGRCRRCGSKISWQYPLVETAAAALSVLIFLQSYQPAGAGAQILYFTFWFVVWMTLLFAAVYDLRQSVIPWSCSILLALLALALVVYTQPLSAYALASGPVLASPLLLLSLVSRGRWMGWGDGALELGLGWLLGLAGGLTALVLAFWSGAVVGIALMLVSKAGLQAGRQVTMKSEMPFAPFLILGALAVHFFNVDFFSALGPLW